MEINKMHELFRTLGQQMGLQLVRAILPESIDNYLNVAIIETARSVIKSNVDAVYQDKISIQFNDLAPVNVLRTLNKEAVFDVTEDRKQPLMVNLSKLTEVMFYTSFDVSYDKIHFFPSRFVEKDKLYWLHTDYLNRPSRDFPIATMVNDKDNHDIVTFYNGDDELPKQVKICYIKLPVKVDYKTSISCDLPEHLHVQVVELAVNKYFTSVGSTSKQV